MAKMFLIANLFLIEIFTILILIRNIESKPEPVSFMTSTFSQSKTVSTFEADLAVDGDLQTCSVAEENQEKNEPPWWRAVLNKLYNVENLMIHFTPDQSENRTINSIKVYVSKDDRKTVETLCLSFGTSRPYIRFICKETLKGHVVTITKDQKSNETLQLCEVQINVDVKTLNVALGRPTSYGSLAIGSKEEFVVDGDIDTCAYIHAPPMELVWWRVTLDDSYYISKVKMYIQSQHYTEIAAAFLVNVYVSNTEESYKDYICGFTEIPNNVEKYTSIAVICARPLFGQYVTIQKYGGVKTWLMVLCEVEIFTEEDISEVQELSLFQVNLIKTTTYQNQSDSNGNPKMAIDSNPDTCFMTQESKSGEHPWWRLELETIYTISELIITSHKLYSQFMNFLNIFVSKNASNFEEDLCVSFLGSSNIFFARHIQLNCKQPIAGNFVTITRNGGFRKDLLVLCEVQLKADRQTFNLAFKKKTFQSGALPTDETLFSVDGKLDTCTLISSDQHRVAWWRVVLDSSYFVTDVNMHFLRKLKEKYNYDINIYVSNHKSYYEEHQCGSYSHGVDKLNGTSAYIKCNKATFGSYVTIKKRGKTLRSNLLLLCEVEVYSKEDPKATTEDEISFDCLFHEYSCHGGRCIPKEWLCDGILDCHLGDDEVPSCKMKCEEGKFKCTKRDLCIDMKAVCDGKVDCEDYSDEHSCFETHTGLEFITATFKGETDFYICSHGWKIHYSIDICQQHASTHLETSYDSVNKSQKFITLEDVDSIYDSVPIMNKFKLSSQCETEKFVKIQCDDTPESFCGTRDDDAASKFGPYIIKGEEAKRGAWPWQVQLLSDGQHFCGGSIISKRWILTAAQCLQNKQPSKIKVKTGTIRLKDPFRKKLPITHVAIHPDFNDSYSNDVALLRLEFPLKFTSTIRPICLPNKELSWRKLMSYRQCVAIGLGSTKAENPEPAKFLKQRRMNIMSNTQCAQYLSLLIQDMSPVMYTYLLDSNKIFCVGSIPTEYGPNACTGDTGNAFVCQDKRGIWTQVGIARSYFISSGDKCTNSIFTHVDRYLDFIYRVMERGEPGSSKGVKDHENIIILNALAIISVAKEQYKLYLK